ncbi:unnamed protein product, partial [Effrenium voratum]
EAEGYQAVLGESLEHGGVLDHREYVVYRSAQVLPRYLLWYRHEDCPCFRCRAAFKLPTLPPLRLPMPHASRDVSPQASPRRSPACSPAPEVPRPNPPPPPAPPPAPSPVSRSVPASARRMYNWESFAAQRACSREGPQSARLRTWAERQTR